VAVDGVAAGVSAVIAAATTTVGIGTAERGAVTLGASLCLHLRHDSCRVCSDVSVFKKLVGLALLSSLLVACSSGSSSAPPAPSRATTHPFGVTLSDIEHFFQRHGAPLTGWTQLANEKESGPLHGMANYTGGAGPLKVDVTGNPADETELSVDDTISGAAGARAANAVMLATVQRFAPGAVAWIRGALGATDGTAGYFGGSSSDDTSGRIALSFSTSDTKRSGLLLILAGGKVA
jgi:hypothetical protein